MIVSLPSHADEDEDDDDDDSNMVQAFILIANGN